MVHIEITGRILNLGVAGRVFRDVLGDALWVIGWGETNQLATINVGCEILDDSQEEYYKKCFNQFFQLSTQVLCFCVLLNTFSIIFIFFLEDFDSIICCISTLAMKHC